MLQRSARVLQQKLKAALELVDHLILDPEPFGRTNQSRRVSLAEARREIETAIALTRKELE